jgi:pimeloyl-ACP methyl ester carboxylesterase
MTNDTGLPRLLVTGSRTWPSTLMLGEGLKLAWFRLGRPDPVVLVHGGAGGADTMADAVARRRPEFQVEVHPADWKTHGNRAGFIRNEHMVTLGADLIVAFIHNESRGATMCLRLAQDAGIPALTIRIDDAPIERTPDDSR